jgi:hypothetical protein
MNYIGKVILTMMLLLLVRLLLLVLILVVMMLTPPTLSHMLWCLPCLHWLQLLMSSMRVSQTMRSPCWQESSASCTGSAMRVGDHLGAASSAGTPPTSSPTTPRGRSLTPPPTSMTTPSRMTTARVMTRRSTASGTKRRRSSKR